jgi:hypothetical protein
MTDKTQSKTPGKSATPPKGYEPKRCENCHHLRLCAYRANSYDVEIRGDRTKRWFCDECNNISHEEV